MGILILNFNNQTNKKLEKNTNFIGNRAVSLISARLTLFQLSGKKSTIFDVKCKIQ